MGFLGISANNIKNIVNQVLTDSSVTVTVTYKSLSSSYSNITRKTTETITSVSSIKALKSEYSLEEIARSGGALKIGDSKFLIRADALSSVTPKIDDRITWDSRDWEVLNIKPVEIGSTEIFYKFHCR